MFQQTKTPWKNGNYYSDKSSYMLLQVDGQSVDFKHLVSLDYPDMDSITKGTWTFGNFGTARKDIEEASGGVTNYNIEMKTNDGFRHSFGVLSEDGKTIYTWGIWNGLEIFKWLSNEDLKKIDDDREPAEAPSCHYKIQPENQGKLVWLSGPPGVGKTTTGQLMSKEAGYVYYEADCMMFFVNPFVVPNVDNPTIATIGQKSLKGISKEFIDAIKLNYGFQNQGVSKEFIDAIKAGKSDSEAMQQRKFDDVDWNKIKSFFANLAKDIGDQKKRIGGHFAVAYAVTFRKIRDHIREVLPDCIFITLTMTKEAQRKRLFERHGEGADGFREILTRLFDLYELPDDGEENTFNVDITEDMTPKDVMNKVLEILKENAK